ncbi:MAG: asparagine--tRNA ligase [Myxococcales bacterium]|nr:asparagine--tRNA ligase [Myxococcales bacterium]MDH5305917.1 asparagine--tRNA ligase [Myxococcales bacterium]MDH5565049.1 asparagine--tRNA ligase [Myxococcales bacterium]
MSESVRAILARERAGGEVSVRGWVRTARHSKGVSFLEISDGSCFAGIQAVVDASLEHGADAARALGTGCAVCVTGALVDSPGTGQRYEIRAQRIERVGDVDSDYPLQKKRHSFEFLREIAHLRPRTNTIGAVLRVRNAAARAIHDFFQERGFVWLHAPIITASDAEGAGEMFRVTTLDPSQPPRAEDGAVDHRADFFGRETFLTVSGQLEAEIGALALTNVYSFGPTFRAENSNTSRHLAEFWMVEPEMAFCDLNGDTELAEAFLKAVFRAVLERCPDDMEFFAERIEPTAIERLQHIVDTPFERISYSEALRILESSGRSFEFPVVWGSDLQSEHERFLAEEHIRRPVVVTDYPAAIKAFYMYLNDDEKTVRAMDVLVPGVGEIIGGSQREHRLDVLRRRMAAQGLDEAAYWWYLDLRRYGSVPHAGFGLGFERAVQFITGMANIRDVIPFPRVPGSAEF